MVFVFLFAFPHQPRSWASSNFPRLFSFFCHPVYRLFCSHVFTLTGRCCPYLYENSPPVSSPIPHSTQTTCNRLKFKHQKQNATKWPHWRVRVKTGPSRISGVKCAKQPRSWGLKSFFHLEPGFYKTVTTLWAFPEKAPRCLATQQCIYDLAAVLAL